MRYIKRKLKIFLPIVLILCALGGQAIVPSGAFACGNPGGSSTDQVRYGADPSGTGTECSGSEVMSIIRAAINVLSIVIGAAAVFVIILSGLRYVTSGGDSAKVTSAKTTLIYALIGVAVAALAQLLVHLVLYQSANAINPPPPATPTVKKP
jgi:hypothetical protein